MPLQSSRSRRLNGYDYSLAGAYFVTICTKNKYPFFGNIESKQLAPTTAAMIISAIWKQIPVQFPFVELDAFVVMPDHIHGIIIIHEQNAPDPLGSLGKSKVDNVGTRLIACPQDFQGSQDQQKQQDQQGPELSKHQPGGFAGNLNPMFHQNLSRIIRWFKGRSTFEIRKSNIPFEWQSNYHDHLIRSTESYERICHYITTNPEKWKQK